MKKVVVSYTYDSWGKLLSIEGELKDTLGVQNPYRYKGYRYDNETGLYYLKARYYNPDLGRFISADAVAGKAGEILSHNLFSYCGNNPVNAIDEDENMFEWIKSAWNNLKGKFKKTAYKVRTRKITTQIKKGVRGVNNATKNIFGRGTKIITNAYKKPHKWVNNSWRNIKKAHHTIVRYTSPGAMVNPKRYASQERMNEDIGTRILKDLQEDMVFVASVLTVAMTMSEINDTLDMYSLSGNGINVFSPGKGFQYAKEIGGDAIKGGSKAKNLYKAEGLLKMDLQKFGKTIKKLDKSSLLRKSEKHIFSDKHIKGKIMDLGNNKQEIMNSGLDIIEKLDIKGMLREGPTQIKTIINGHEAEIRIFIKDGKIMNFDMFKGHSPRNMGNTIKYP
ncbi:RHS repeat-associated core domain-containing protein [Clostridium sporogenes]|uniref:RHS repeat-associated core domain-containing protein n=1 Tax=Clostridium botulinum TaxID=1491 RepID=UPI0007175964|nr:RHS repeat-associated core domain-containing protein [Clostridium botulinum]KRU24980.1 RHS repeat-associated core domain-containing protein [Clostridium sporogenes]KRU31873.1 RHS repeat-associated core domain-containing protein [Clostridium sporogenes]KRU34141.1 RHS repeat-associated core domain-containing protein [Clostridium sporogenes]KRU41158.1 RHS repeat-associated core domain-containing protein [Clostridium sporogenes]MCW6071059.1 RHS repeat-associated core domain-containing protein [